jgi:protein-S-isoprenylcysteine O-methyltransferase Ste14
VNKTFLGLQLVAVACAVAVMVLYPGPWNLQRCLGAGLALTSLAFLLTARFQLGSSFSVTAQARHLVTHGIYSKIRNPIYVFGMFVIIGYLMVIQKPAAWLLVPVVLIAQIVRARREAALLEEKFGDEYREYRRQTWF